jgi:FkbM family methyltransferase
MPTRASIAVPSANNRLSVPFTALELRLPAPPRVRINRSEDRVGEPAAFALDELDRKVLPHLPDRPGVFIEAGAHDGLTQSNTAMLEFSFGWTGLLVEPIPELAARCRLNRPGALVEQAALVAVDYAEESIRMTYCNRSSIVEGGRGSHARDAAWLEACRRLPDQRDIEPYEVVVPARTLSSILDDRRITDIDFMSLDLEGYEAAALRGLDFERHRPTVMLVEISNDRQEIERALSPWYKAIAELSDHRAEQPPWYDVLYRAR